MANKIDKIEGARRQLDTAIDLYFNGGDSLSMHTLAFAALKVLFNIYPHKASDGFHNQLDAIIGEMGWKSMSDIANFLKHADRDPDGMLAGHHPDMAYSIMGLATLLYRRVAGEFSPKMAALDFWTETLAAEELGIPESDQNPDRAMMNKRIRQGLNHAPRETRMGFAKRHYEFFLANHERLKREVEEAVAKGRSLQDILDEKLSQNADK